MIKVSVNDASQSQAPGSSYLNHVVGVEPQPSPAQRWRQTWQLRVMSTQSVSQSVSLAREMVLGPATIWNCTFYQDTSVTVTCLSVSLVLYIPSHVNCQVCNTKCWQSGDKTQYGVKVEHQVVARLDWMIHWTIKNTELNICSAQMCRTQSRPHCCIAITASKLYHHCFGGCPGHRPSLPRLVLCNFQTQLGRLLSPLTVLIHRNNNRNTTLRFILDNCSVTLHCIFHWNVCKVNLNF